MKKLTELVHLREKLTQAYDPKPAANELLHLNEKITSICLHAATIFGMQKRA